jgi:hypothetical protein
MARLRLAPIFIFLILSGCDTVNDFYQQGLEMVGLADPKPNKKPKNKTGKTEKSAADDDDEANPEGDSKKNPGGGDIVVKKQVVAEKTSEKSDLKTAKAPAFTVDAPVDVQKRIGGNARFISADEEFVYLDFPQHFAIYDKALKRLAYNPVAFPVKKVARMAVKDKVYLYLEEENHVFEIFELQSQTTGDAKQYSLVDVKSFEVDGPFIWVNAKELAIFLKDKIQLLDLSDVNSAKILGNIDLGEVTSGMAFGKYLYLAQPGILSVIDIETETILSSVRVGKTFGFFGLDKKGGKRLLLSILDESGAVTGIQTLNLAEDYSGVLDFAETRSLGLALKDAVYDPVLELLYGHDAKAPVGLMVYSLAHNLALRGTLADLKDLVSWFVREGSLYLVGGNGVSVNALLLNGDIIDKHNAIKAADANAPKAVPLAQVGAGKTVLDEYTLNPLAVNKLMADSQKVVLLDGNHFLTFEQVVGEASQRIFASDNFASDDFMLKEITPDVALSVDRLLPTDFGTLAWSAKDGSIRLIDVNFKFTLLPITAAELRSWQQITTKMGEVLILSTKKKDVRAPYAIQLHLLKSPTETELLSELAYEKPVVGYRGADGKLAVLTPGRIEFFDMTDPRQPALLKEGAVLFADKKYDFLAAKLTPLQDRVLALFKEGANLKILVLDLKDFSKRGVLDDFEITRDEFDGASFSRGGQLLILPTEEGTLFYDIKDLKNIREAAHWPLPANYIDVTQAGRYICVALGVQGVYCGNLLF